MRNFILYFFLCTGPVLFCQRIQNFSLNETGNKVAVKFAIGKGNQCGGYNIWHSIDSVNFNIIYNYPGVCGDVSITQDYSYTHGMPAPNSINYYKIELVATETSGVMSIFVPAPPDENILAYPVPISNSTDALTIKVGNNGPLSGYLYNQLGKPIKVINTHASSYSASIPVSELTNGVYLLRLSSGSKTYSTRFIINR